MQILSTMTTADEAELSVQASGRPAQRADQVRARARKAMKSALGELLTQPEVASLSASLIGALVSIAQRLLAPPLNECSPRIRQDEARAVLQMRGSSHAEACGALEALSALGLLRLDESLIGIDAVDTALGEHFRLLENRSQGWVKRLKDASSGAGGGTPSTPRSTAPSAPSKAASRAPSSAASASRASQSSTGSLPGFELDAPAPKNPLVRRFGASEREEPSSDDPTVVFIPCKGGKTAEVTRSYADLLQLTFKTLDIDQQLLLATNWCRSNIKKQKTFEGLRGFLNFWMGRALETTSVRAAVVQAAHQGNGFGQGGGYSTAAVPAQPAHPAVNDFDDLLDLDVPEAPTAHPTAVAPGARPFRQVPGSFRTRPGFQRRLSDPRGG